MKPLITSLLLTSVCLFSASVGYAGDGKQIAVQEQPAPPVSQNAWEVYFTPYLWLPSALVDISVPDIRVGRRVIGGDFSIDQPWWETLSKFSSDFYVLSLSGRLEAWKGRWGGELPS
jgi:hypothetical protein